MVAAMVLEEPQRPCRYAHLPTTPISFASAADATLQNTSMHGANQARNSNGTKRPGLGMSIKSKSDSCGSIVVDCS